ncbi:MAG: metallophosphoesterase [Candidatus Pacearchaeota archaeon]
MVKNKINVKIEILEDSLLIDDKILVISDLHLGYEESLENIVLIPKYQYKEIIEKLNRIFYILKKNKVILEKIIILGDLKHEFSKNIYSEWKEILKLLDFLYLKCKKIIIIRGNHDNYIINIIKKKKIQLNYYYKYKNICFLHGNLFKKEWVLNCKTLILGHLHPSITLSDKYKKEKYSCFLYGFWKNFEIYIIPSFSPISIGYNLNNILYDSKFINKFIINGNTIKKFQVIIYNNKENRLYKFGKLFNLLNRN